MTGLKVQEYVKKIEKMQCESSLLIGYTHGSISEIMRLYAENLVKDNHDAFTMLLDLLQHLNKEVTRIFYSDGEPLPANITSHAIVEAAMKTNDKILTMMREKREIDS